MEVLQIYPEINPLGSKKNFFLLLKFSFYFFKNFFSTYYKFF